MTDRQSIEMEAEVPGTVEQVWRAIATGPGISSWYVPHEVEEVAGGAMTASFGPGMEVEGRVGVWEPPHRITFEGGEDGPGLAFEWFVEARDGGSCVVRLVNSGFGSGEEWDDQYDAMTEGWKIFFTNLRLHLEHFAGQAASPALPMGMWECSPDDAWTHLIEQMGFPVAPNIGASVSTEGVGAPPLVGVVEAVSPHCVSLLVSEPAAGTAFVAAENYGASSGVSVWLYLYGEDSDELASTNQAAWNTWLADIAP